MLFYYISVNYICYNRFSSWKALYFIIRMKEVLFEGSCKAVEPQRFQRELTDCLTINRCNNGY